jgi:hypothetical protein
MVPDDYEKGFLVKLPEEKSFTNFYNWTAVVLLSVSSKVLESF